MSLDYRQEMMMEVEFDRLIDMGVDEGEAEKIVEGMCEWEDYYNR